MLKAMAEEMGIDLSHKALAKGCPSVKTLKNWELNLAGDCLGKVIWQIAKDAKRLRDKYGPSVKLQITLVTDHGNREGVDHFVKMICWSSVDEKGNHILRHFNLDIDKGGHSTDAAANAIWRSLKALDINNDEVEIGWICGDSGGGAKVQMLQPTLVAKSVMDEDSDFVNCLLHALNLAYETACKDSLGEAGMNRCTTFQLIYLAILMLTTIKKRTNLHTVKSYYSTVMTMLMEDEEYKHAAKDNFVQAFEKLIEVTDDAAEDETDEQREERLKDLINGCPTDVNEPNFSRWGTVSFVARIVLDHWLPLFYMAQNIRDNKDNGSYLHVIATKLIDLMSSKADPNQKTPTHYVSLQWVVAFGENMFDGNMNWAKRNDPTFGVGSYGHICRLVPEHLFVMEEQLKQLKNGGWKEKPEFKDFIDSVDGISNQGTKEKCGKEFFERLPDLFLERFEMTFHDHTKKWRDRKTLPIIIAGHPAIAKAYIYDGSSTWINVLVPARLSLSTITWKKVRSA
jgi:hypothetical protein